MRPALPTFLMACALAATLSSCNPRAGTWNDDPKNWSRAFRGQPVPPGFTVHHSYYWRSPHFTYEDNYYFEFDAPAEMMATWIKYANVQIVDSTPDNLGLGPDKPAWFLAKSPDRYLVWRPSDDNMDNFRIYQDKETGRYYVHDAQ